MAINLWAAAGKPTAYSPLPTGFVNFVPTGINDYTVSFKAKSNSEAVLEVFTPTYSPGRAFGVLLSLTKEFKTYNYTFKGARSEPFYFYDNQSKGDIIIENITLVEKPIPPIRKPKKNLLPPFSQWTLHANAKVVAPYEAELNAGAAGQESGVYIPVLPNTTYNVKFEHNGQYAANNMSGIGQFISIATGGWITHSNAVTFTTAANAKFVYVYFSSNATGKFTFKNPMLTEGTTAQPFEPFVPVNSRAVKGAKKNLLTKSDINTADLSLQAGVSSGVGFYGFAKEGVRFLNNAIHRYAYLLADYTPGKTYVFSVFVKMDDGSTPVIGSPTTGDFSLVIKGDVPLGASKVESMGDGLYRVSQSYVVGSSINNTGVIKYPGQSSKGFVVNGYQLEEGTTATPYEPYREVNKRAGLVPKKNLFDANMESGYYTPQTGVAVASVSHKRNVNFMSVLPGKTYQLNKNTNNNFYAHYYDANKVVVSSVQYLAQQAAVLIIPANATFVRFHLDDNGSTNGVNYALYEFFDISQKINPPAPKGIIMDGVTNYVQLPSMTMDSVEIDCLIDASSQGSFLLDARSGLVNGYVSGANGSGWFEMLVDGTKKDEIKINQIPPGKRVKVFLKAPQQFTESLEVFTNSSAGIVPTKGIIYGVKCYRNGNIVAEYDFTTENTKAMSVLSGTKTWRNKLAKR